MKGILRFLKSILRMRKWNHILKPYWKKMMLKGEQTGHNAFSYNNFKEK